MKDTRQYPKDDEIRVVLGKLRILLLACSTVLIWPAFFHFNPVDSLNLTELLSALGLYIDIIGVVVASLKTPYYGSFHDGGAIEIKRAKIEANYFKVGMLLIGLGFLLQAFGSFL